MSQSARGQAPVLPRLPPSRAGPPRPSFPSGQQTPNQDTRRIPWALRAALSRCLQAPAEGSCSSWSGRKGPSRPLWIQMLERLPTSLWADSSLLSAGGSPLSCESSPSSAQQNVPFPLAGTLATSCWSPSLCCPQRGPCPSPCLVGPCQEGLGSEPGSSHL